MGKRTRDNDQLLIDWRCKRCPRCERVVAGWDFAQSRGRKNGLGSYCLKCTRIIMADLYARSPDHRAKKRVRDKEYLERNPGADRKRASAWYKANKKRRNAASRAWSDANRQRHRQLNKEWAQAHPDAIKAIWSRYYARKSQATTVGFNGSELAQRWAYYGNKCWICGSTATATDHVKPLAKGGAHMLCNLRPICQPCNSAKRDKWPFTLDGAAR